MKAIIVTVVYVVGLFIGDYLHYGPFEAWMMFQYNAWGYGGLALALALTDPRVSWRRTLGRVRAAMWAYWRKFVDGLCRDFACPKCHSTKIGEPTRHQYQCFECGEKF